MISDEFLHRQSPGKKHFFDKHYVSDPEMFWKFSLFIRKKKFCTKSKIHVNDDVREIKHRKPINSAFH